MNDLRRISIIATFMLVTLRLAIGWQFLYEGLWKVSTLSSPQPWTAAGYLKNAQGPLRDVFRNMAGDPNELGWLDVEQVAAGWDAWQARFQSHYALSDSQKTTLNRWLNGSKEFVAVLDELPPEVDFKKLRLDSVVSYDAEKKRLIVDGERHLKPDEKQKLLAAVPADSPGGNAFRQAVEAVYKRSKDGLSFKEQLRAVVLGNPDVVGDKKLQYLGEVDQYKSMLAEYERDVAQAQENFDWDHLNYTWGKIQAKRSELVGPVKALDAELKEQATSLLSVDQLSVGPVPEPWTSQRVSDLLTIVGLTVLGAMLVMGLGTRVAAILGAGMLLMFYLAMPPWPGVPEIPGPEHSYVVNKNLIEVVALLAIAAMPTGRWFGLDGLLRRLIVRRRETA